MLDPMTSLAFAVYSGKGVHALLLGSGISRSSGIPTGWEIVLDLIRKVAAIEGKECGHDPAGWFLSTYGKEPDYSELLDLTARTSAERMQLLRGYFEPDAEDREAGNKLPTPAHHAIARLVADGYIRVIVTTNFDRLMEQALEGAGVMSSIIASKDSILGAAPLSQSPCTIIKVHGDYLDTRLKNTPGEVGKYDQATNRLLNQVFDEYGLIVSGWSAEWDVALRAAIERCTNRRYTMYWAAYNEVAGTAKGLCQRRDAQVIIGMGADDFFVKLSEKIASLDYMETHHPLTPKIAVATLKRYIAEDKDRIRLHDLVTGETDRVATAMLRNLGMRSVPPSLKQYEDHLENLLPLMIAGGYWGGPKHRRLWLLCIEKMVTPRMEFQPTLSLHMDYYPAYLVLYAFGIAALAGGRPLNLAYILARGQAKSENNEDFSLIHRMVMMLRGGELDNAIERADHSYSRTNLQTSRYLLEKLRSPFQDWIPERGRYEELFCRFEYLVGLVVSDLYQKLWGPGFGSTHGWYYTRRSLPAKIQEEIEKQKERWPFLRAGLFDGSLARLKEVKEGFDEASAKQRMQIHMF